MPICLFDLPYGCLADRLICSDDSELKEDRTFFFKGVFELDTPLSLGPVQLEHTNTHNKDQEGGDKRE